MRNTDYTKKNIKLNTDTLQKMELLHINGLYPELRRILSYAFVLCLTLLTLTSCAEQQIPAAAQSFINQYFPGMDVVLVEMDDDDEGKEYSVWLNDGTKVEFDLQGEWKRVGRKKTGVPVKLIPPTITEYVKAHYPADVVSKLSKKPYGYKIELSNDMDLRFDTQGKFLEVID